MYSVVFSFYWELQSFYFSEDIQVPGLIKSSEN